MAWEKRGLPFAHWVNDFDFDNGDTPLIAADVLAHRERHPEKWVRYRNDCEHKDATTDTRLSLAAAALFDFLTGESVVRDLAALTGVPGLTADPLLHGAGFHVVPPGGFLAPHLDYARHPKLPGLERRVNLLLFLAGGPGRGGAFELYADDGRTVVSRVGPVPGRAVVWCPGDVEYHGTERTTATRVAAACYYLAPARETAVRKRALFCPNRGT